MKVKLLFRNWKNTNRQVDQIPAELIQARGEILLPAIHKLINSVWNEEELPDQWKESIIVPVHKKGDKTDCKLSWNITAVNFIQHFIKISFSQG
jgi:hypothetical protein